MRECAMKNDKKFRIQRIMWSVFPFLLALILALLCGENFFSSGKSCFIEINKITLDLEGTLLGFIITVVSILIAFNGSRLTEEVKQTGHFRTVLFIYLITCAELFISIAFSMCLVITKVYNVILCTIYLTLLFMAAFYMILCLFFLSLIVYTIFK